MACELYAFEMLTGRRLTPLPASGGSWKVAVNSDESITATVPARSVDAALLDIWGSTTLGSVGLLAVEDGMPVAAGPLWKRRYTQGGNLEFTAAGLRSYLNRRVLIQWQPPGFGNVRTSSLVWPDGTVFDGYSTHLTGLSLGTIAKRYVEATMAWPGGNLPIVLPPDELGTHDRNIAAIDLKFVGKLLDDLTAVTGGPDIAFRPHFADDGLGIYWQMEVGSEAVPRLGNTDASLIRWTVGAPTGGAFGLTVDEDGTDLAAEGFGTAGNAADVTLYSRFLWTNLGTAGFPLLQRVDTSHSTITDAALLTDYVKEGTRLAIYPRSFWAMKSRKVAEGTPKLGDYWLGDLATVTVDPEEPILTPKDYVRRIASIGGAVGQEHYDLVFAEAIA
jgi:hypothetical protein